MNIPYHLSRLFAYLNREAFKERMLSLKNFGNFYASSSQTIPYSFYFLCCQRDWPEQVASLLSLFANVGIPQAITIVSDGSISPRIHDLLESISPAIRVVDYRSLIPVNVSESVLHFSTLSPMGIKFLVESTISSYASHELPVIYSDTDILFLSDSLVQILANGLRPNGPFSGVYLLDCLPSIDKNLDPSILVTWKPLNAGFLAWSEEPDWSPSFSALETYFKINDHTIGSSLTHHSEQTLVQLAMTGQRYSALPHYSYIVSIDDQFLYKDLFVSTDRAALRHYVGNVRHKFWHSLPKVLPSRCDFLFPYGARSMA
jgi:hypothetical protein